MDQPKHLEVRQLTEEEYMVLLEVAPEIESLLENRGTADINTDPPRLGVVSKPFRALFHQRVKVPTPTSTPVSMN